MGFKILIWGGNGWIGSMLVKMLQENGHEVIIAKSRLQDYISICEELTKINPDFVVNCAGITGIKSIDWCEDHKEDTILINTIGVVNLADACWRKGIHMTNYSTGCIYKYDDTHPITPGNNSVERGIGKGFTEKELPNFDGSTYSISKVESEKLLSYYNNVLILRIRMPISDDLHPKSLVTKLSKYPKVLNIPNSVTVLSDILPITLDMMKRKLTGIYNCSNPGTITHNEILELYKKYVDPNIKWDNFTEEEQNAVLKSKRSNCELDTTKLTNLYSIPNIYEAVKRDILKIKMKLN